MRSASLRQTAQGLRLDQTHSLDLRAQSAGSVNGRGLDAWRSGQETGWCTETGEVIKAFLRFPTRSAPRLPLSREPSSQQVHRGAESSWLDFSWCVSNWSPLGIRCGCFVMVLIYGRTSMHFPSPKRLSFGLLRSKTYGGHKKINRLKQTNK